MIIIGEKINGSIPSVAEAIAKRDAEFIKQRARIQDEAGATFIDCCASVPEAEEVETLKWMIDCIQEVSDLPISIDSPSARVLAEAYKFCKKPGLFNSVSGEGDKIDVIFPIMAENKGWECIALCSDDTGIPKNAADRLKVFDKIMAKAKEYGIRPSRLHIDRHPHHRRHLQHLVQPARAQDGEPGLHRAGHEGRAGQRHTRSHQPGYDGRHLRHRSAAGPGRLLYGIHLRLPRGPVRPEEGLTDFTL